MIDRTGVLPKSPLIFAVSSVRFTPWSRLSQKISEIQDALRDELPVFKEIQIGRPSPNGAVEQTHLWVLSSVNSDAALLLSQDQIFFFTKKYERFDGFKKIWSRILESLFQQMKFMHVVNMGMRYIDRIEPAPGETLDQYISEHFLPPKYDSLTPIGGNVFSSYKTENAELRVKVNTLPEAPEIPEEMLPWVALLSFQDGIPVPLQVPKLNGKALLDMDTVSNFSPAQRMDNAAEIVDRTEALHRIPNAFFRNSNALKDHAFATWKTV